MVELDFLSREPYLIQWFKDGQLLPGENFSLLAQYNLSESDSGVYQARITNEIHEVLSNEFELNVVSRSEEHTSELQSRRNLVCRLLLEKKNKLKKK